MNEFPPTRRTYHGEIEVVPAAPRTRPELLREAILAVPHLVLLLTRLLRDPEVPRRSKMIAGAALAYVVSPFDVLPDAIPLLGRVDDVVILAASIHHLMRSVSEARLAGYWAGSQDTLDLVAGLVEWGADLVPAPLRRMMG